MPTDKTRMRHLTLSPGELDSLIRVLECALQAHGQEDNAYTYELNVEKMKQFLGINFGCGHATSAMSVLVEAQRLRNNGRRP